MKKLDLYKLAESFLQDKNWQNKWDETFKEILSEPISSLNQNYTFNNHAKDIISALLFAQALHLANKVISMREASHRIETIGKEIKSIVEELGYDFPRKDNERS